jgi:hypothetical protein
MNEQGVQSKIIKKLEARGAYVVKVITATRSGVADILACVPTVITEDMVGQSVGIFSALEVKRPIKPSPLSKLQKYHLEKVRQAGGLSGVVHSVEETKKVLDGTF